MLSCAGKMCPEQWACAHILACGTASDRHSLPLHLYVSHCNWQFAHVAGSQMQLVQTQEQMHQDACCVLCAKHTWRGCMSGHKHINSRSTLDDTRTQPHTSAGGAKAMDCVVLYVPRCLSFSKAVGFLVSLASLKVASLFVSVSLSNT